MPGGPTLQLFDWRGHEGDIRTAALHAAVEGCDLVLLWTAGGDRQGLMSRIKTERFGGLSEVYIFAGRMPDSAAARERAALVFWSVPRDYETFVAALAAATAG